MHKTIILFSLRFYFGIFRTFTLHSFFHFGICKNKYLPYSMWKFFETYSCHLIWTTSKI